MNASQTIADAAIDLADEALLQEAKVKRLYDTNPLGIAISEEADRQYEALLRFHDVAARNPYKGREGTKANGEARPVADGGSKKSGTARLQKVTVAERRAQLLAAVKGEIYIAKTA